MIFLEAYITEVMAKQRANEILIHVYEFAIEDQTQKYEGVYKIYKAWQRANNYMPLGFNQSTIVAFEAVQNLLGYEPIRHEQKTRN